MAGNTVVASGSTAGNRLFNAALFAEACRRNSMTNMLTGESPKAIKGGKIDPKKQTSPGAPIVRISDLSKEMGDEVTVDLFHQLGGHPTMGDRELEGRVRGLTSSQFGLKIDQGRYAVSSGGKMSQQRTKHNLQKIAKQMIGPWWSRLDDQLTLVHMAGARGDDAAADWNIPLSDHPEFSEILVNPLTPPTYDRHVLGGDATSFGNIDSADKFSLAEVDKLRLKLDEMAYPLQPIRFEKDPQADENPFYVLYVTPRQWNDFWTSTDSATGGVALRNLQAEAGKRASVFKHPIFMGDCAMWNGILIKKMARPIVFNSGSTVAISTNTADAQTSSDTAAVRIERALLLGAQALATGFGRHEAGTHFAINTELKDHKNKREHSIAWINGKAKLRFKGTDGRVNDHGVIALDTAVTE